MQAQRLPYPLLTDQSEFLRKSFGIKGDLLGYAPAAPHMLPAILRIRLHCHRHSSCLLICGAACSSSPALTWLASSGANGDIASLACSSHEHSLEAAPLTQWLMRRLLPGRQTYVLDKAGKVALSFNDQVLFTGRLLLTCLGCQCEQQSKLDWLVVGDPS